MECKCEDWAENMPKVNAPLMLAVARNPDTAQQYDGKPFEYCPWCGEELPTRKHMPCRGCGEDTEYTESDGTVVSVLCSRCVAKENNPSK